MNTYPKIETLFERNDNFTVNTSRLRRPEFGLINQWVVTEKIDGTNVRLLFRREGNWIGYNILGRSDNASFHSDLLAALKKIIADCHDGVSEIMEEHNLTEYGLYGEGYGAKIQNGGRYRPDPGFILFDVQAGNSWLDEDQVTQTAVRLGLARVPILFRHAKTTDVITRVGLGLTSVASADITLPAEGVVARTSVPLYDRRGNRVMWKLKTKDFNPGKK